MLTRRVRRPILIIAACLALFAGMALARWHDLPHAYWMWPLLLLALLSIRSHSLITMLLVAVCCFGLGWWRGTAYMYKLTAHAQLHHQKVTVIGRATDEAVYGKRQQLEFTLTEVRVAEPQPQRLVGNITVRGFGEAMVYRGDIVQVSGKLYPTLGNNLASISFADIKVVQPGDAWLDRIRRNFAAGMQSALPEPHASFALGLLIGQRTTLPEATDDALRAVGLTHIIAVSGYNLTVIVLACRRLLADRSKFQATAACGGLIAIFLLITGSSPPLVRASIICVLGIAAWYYGRTVKPLVLLLVGAVVTVLANPLYLWSSVSWYLSFLAFFGVLVLAPLITKRLFGSKEPKMLTSILIESACASVLVLPYVLYIFGETSLVGLAANVLVVPFIPFAMLAGLLAGLGGLFVPAIAGWFAWPAKLLLTYMLDIATLLSRLPHALVQDIAFPLPAMLGAYAAIGFVCLVLWRRTRGVLGNHSRI